MSNGAIVVAGSFWGDCGKGLLSAYLSAREDASLVCRAGTGSNAEHGIFTEDKQTYLKVNQLPLGFMMNPNTQIRIGSGTAVNPSVLFTEMQKYGLQGRVRVDYRCPITTQEHIDAERNSKLNSAIGSTFSGTGYTRSDFVLRKAKQARDFECFNDMTTDLGIEINKMAETSTVIVESSQGTMLGLATTPDYPNATSDNVSAVAAMDDVLLNWRKVKDVYLAVKAVPSREGSGSMGGKELSEEEIIKRGWFEASSIGGVTRRKAEGINFEMLKYVVEINGATKIFLSFLDHYDPEVTDVLHSDLLTPKVWNLINKIEESTNIPVEILNTGKSYNSIIDLSVSHRMFVNWDKIDNTVAGLRRKYESWNAK